MPRRYSRLLLLSATVITAWLIVAFPTVFPALTSRFFAPGAAVRSAGLASYSGALPHADVAGELYPTLSALVARSAGAGVVDARGAAHSGKAGYTSFDVSYSFSYGYKLLGGGPTVNLTSNN